MLVGRPLPNPPRRGEGTGGDLDWTPRGGDRKAKDIWLLPLGNTLISLWLPPLGGEGWGGGMQREGL